MSDAQENENGNDLGDQGGAQGQDAGGAGAPSNAPGDVLFDYSDNKPDNDAGDPAQLDDNDIAARQAAAGGERPEGLEAKFWDEDNGEIKLDLLIRNHNELLKKFSSGDHERPDAADGYEIGLDEQTLNIVTGGQGADDPLLGVFRERALEAGLSKDQFNTILGGFAEAMAEMAPAPFDRDAEIAKLGKGGPALVEHAKNFGEAMIKQGVFDEADLREWQIANGSAEGIKMMNKLRAHLGDSSIPTNPGESAAVPDEGELRDMLNDKRYGVDNAFTQKVDEMYNRKYGNKPAHSSKSW